MTQILRAIGRSDQQSNASVADETAVEEVEGFDYPSRTLLIIQSDELAHHRHWVECCVPLPLTATQPNCSLVVPHSAI